MKKRIIVQNSTPKSKGTGDNRAGREARLRQELRDNLKKRKAQQRAQSGASKNGQN